MKVIKTIFAILILIICLLIDKTALAAEAPYVKVDYTVAVDGQTLKVTAILSNIENGDFYISFTDKELGVDNLSSRISNFTATSINKQKQLVVKNLGKGLYQVDTAGNKNIIVTYDFNPFAVKHDVGLTTLTSSYLHIPGMDFFMRVYDNKNDVNDIKKVVCKDFSVKIKGYKNDWKVLSSTPISSDGTILANDYEALIHVGSYKTFNFEAGNNNFSIAVDNEAQFDFTEYNKYLKDIINYYNDIFNSCPQNQILIVINQGRDQNTRKFTPGGQVRGNNIILEFNGLNKNNQNKNKSEVVKVLSHEVFHFWIPRAFNRGDDWSWFWEGFTEYQAFRSLAKIGLINKDDFNRQIAKMYFNYEYNDLKYTKNVVAVSEYKHDNADYTSLIYDKGALIAYLYEKRLNQIGKDYDSFMSDLYDELALPGKSITSNDIIEYMNKTIGDDTFCKKYVQGVEPLTISPIREFGLSYFLKYFTRKPQFPFNYLIPSVFIVILSIFIFVIIKKRLNAK